MKHKVIVIITFAGALLGYFLLSPFAMYISHVVHAKTPQHMMSIFDVFKPYLMLWSMSFTTFGGITGLIIGLLYYRVTERNKRIKKAKEYTDLVLNSMGEGMLTIDRNYMILNANKAFLKTTDFSLNHIVGKHCYEVLHGAKEPCKTPEHLCLLKEVLKTENTSMTTHPHIDKDGNKIYLELSASPIKDEKGNIVQIIEIFRDITERKRAEDRLNSTLLKVEEEKAKSEAIIAAIGDTISIQDTDFKILYQNRINKERMGEHVGEYCYNAYQHSDNVCEGCHLETSFKDGKIRTTERSVHTDKGKRHVEITVSPLRDSTGKIIAGIEIVRDITERKRAEEELKKLQEELERKVDERTAELSLERNKLKSILDSMNDGVYIVNQKYDIEYINPVIEKEFGPVNGRKCYEYYHNRTEVCPWCKNQEIFVGKSVQWEWFSSKTGKTYELFDTPIRNADGSVSKLEIFHDITVRKNAEEALRGSEEKFRTVVDNIAIGISLISPDMEVLSVNRQVRKWFPEIEIDKKPICYKAFNNPPRQDICSYCPTKKTLQDGEVHEAITETPAGDGIVNYRIISSPLRDAEGNIIAAIEMVEDITEERENELRLILNERLASLGQMASGIAHEINNPLASISGCTEGLLTRLKKGQYDPELFENYLKIIEEEVFRSKVITTDMLSFVRQATYEHKEIDINSILSKSLEIIDFQGRLKKVKVINDFSDELPVIFGNEGELRQVFMTILTNALDAMEEKGTLTIETGIIPPSPPLTKGGKGGITEKGGEGDSVFIKISDTGSGILPTHINRIFEPFFTTKSERGGTGLGLSIARKIIQNHHGNIDVISEKGIGTTFKITLPA